MTEFTRQVHERILKNGEDLPLKNAGQEFLLESLRACYSNTFSWLSRPIIQYPQDMAALQEIIWATHPDLILETGIAHGVSLIFSASILALLDMCDAIEAHPMFSRITMIQVSSIAPEVVEQVRTAAAGYSRVLVCLDSMHTHAHVLAELRAQGISYAVNA